MGHGGATGKIGETEGCRPGYKEPTPRLKEQQQDQWKKGARWKSGAQGSCSAIGKDSFLRRHSTFEKSKPGGSVEEQSDAAPDHRSDSASCSGSEESSSSTSSSAVVSNRSGASSPPNPEELVNQTEISGGSAPNTQIHKEEEIETLADRRRLFGRNYGINQSNSNLSASVVRMDACLPLNSKNPADPQNVVLASSRHLQKHNVSASFCLSADFILPLTRSSRVFSLRRDCSAMAVPGTLKPSTRTLRIQWRRT